MLFYLIDIVRGMLEIYYIMIYNDIPMLVIHPHPWYIKMFPNWQDYPSGWARALSAGDANAAHARELMAFAEAGCCFRYRKTGLFGIENGWDMLRRFFWNFPAIPKCQIPSYSLLKYQRCFKMIVFCVVIASLSHVWDLKNTWTHTSSLGKTMPQSWNLQNPNKQLVSAGISWYADLMFLVALGCQDSTWPANGRTSKCQTPCKSMAGKYHSSNEDRQSCWVSIAVSPVLILTMELGACSNQPFSIDSPSHPMPRNLAIAASFFATFSGRRTAGKFGTFTELGLGTVAWLGQSVFSGVSFVGRKRSSSPLQVGKVILMWFWCDSRWCPFWVSSTACMFLPDLESSWIPQRQPSRLRDAQAGGKPPSKVDTGGTGTGEEVMKRNECEHHVYNII